MEWALVLRTGTRVQQILATSFRDPPLGCSYATEAARAVRDWAFIELGLHRLIAHCEPETIGSLHVLRKLNFLHGASIALPRGNGEVRSYLTFVAMNPKSIDR